MSNGLPDWDQMSVRDQTNQLDARIQNLAERIVDLESSCEIADHHEVVALCERVAKLEQQADAAPRTTTGSRRVNRWRAIEEAAAEVVDTFSSFERERAICRLRRAIEMA